MVDEAEAVTRVRAACDARDETDGPLILARTDARAVHGLDEAIRRCQLFVEAGADMTFLEAPASEEEMARCARVPRALRPGSYGGGAGFLLLCLLTALPRVGGPRAHRWHRYCQQVDGPKLANMVPYGLTPILSADALANLGYSLAIYPTALLSASVAAYDKALKALHSGLAEPPGLELDFGELQRRVGFEAYWEEEQRYGIARHGKGSGPGEASGPGTGGGGDGG